MRYSAHGDRDASGSRHIDSGCLKALVVAQHQRLLTRDREVEHLQLLIARLQRMQFGRKSEKLAQQIEQLELRLEELQSEPVEDSSPEAEPSVLTNKDSASTKPARHPLPGHLPRQTRRYEPKESACPDCGGMLRKLGEDVSEMLEYVPASFFDTCAKSPGPAMPRSIGRLGAGACTIRSQWLQLSFGTHVANQDGGIASHQFSRFGDDIGDDADAVLQAFPEVVGAPIGIGRKKRAEQVSGGVDFHAVETGGFGAANGLRKLPGHLFDFLSGHRARLSFPGGKRLGRRCDRVGQLDHPVNRIGELLPWNLEQDGEL